MIENITSKENVIINNLSNKQISVREQTAVLLQNSPLPKEELIDCLQLFSGRQNMQRLLFLDQIYKEIINIHGVIMEFGVRWGVNMSNMICLRSIYEPFNPTRKIIGFDTFEGFPEVSTEDGNGVSIKVGSHTVAENYELYLEQVLLNLEKDAPIDHIKKFELIKGDATLTVPEYLENNKETLISLAYFDFDIYLPTKKVLEQIKSRLVKGAIIAFDELNYHRYPGETLAFLEVMGANNYKLIRSPNSGTVSYLKY